MFVGEESHSSALLDHSVAVATEQLCCSAYRNGGQKAHLGKLLASAFRHRCKQLFCDVVVKLRRELVSITYERLIGV
jgi:hypothetical protein